VISNLATWPTAKSSETWPPAKSSEWLGRSPSRPNLSNVCVCVASDVCCVGYVSLD